MINKKPILIVSVLLLILILLTIIINSFFESFNNDDRKETIYYQQPFEYIGGLNDLSYLSENETVIIVLGPFNNKENNPIPNVKVSIYFPNRILTNYTTKVGIVYFELNFPIPHGTYLMVFEANGYETNFATVEL